MRNLLFTLILSTALIGNANARGHHTRKVRPAAVPSFSAKSYLIADSTGLVLKEYDMDAVLPIASISKLIVALLSVEFNLEEDLQIPTYREVQSSIPVKVTHLTRRELLTLALVKSDNLAAQVLCANIDNCVERMNSRAADLGMTHTHYVEPTGLSAENISTANDLLKLLMVAGRDPVITQLSSMPTAEIQTDGKPIKIKNTNPLTSKYDISLSKTGYTKPAGGCLVLIMNSQIGQRILILLGSRNARTRFYDMERLIKNRD
jgi:D-alanyl-D-alanine endopeptidase (penicillin-binding protein 7)